MYNQPQLAALESRLALQRDDNQSMLSSNIAGKLQDIAGQTIKLDTDFNNIGMSNSNQLQLLNKTAISQLNTLNSIQGIVSQGFQQIADAMTNSAPTTHMAGMNVSSGWKQAKEKAIDDASAKKYNVKSSLANLARIPSSMILQKYDSYEDKQIALLAGIYDINRNMLKNDIERRLVDIKIGRVSKIDPEKGIEDSKLSIRDSLKTLPGLGPILANMFSGLKIALDAVIAPTKVGFFGIARNKIKNSLGLTNYDSPTELLSKAGIRGTDTQERANDFLGDAFPKWLEDARIRDYEKIELLYDISQNISRASDVITGKNREFNTTTYSNQKVKQEYDMSTGAYGSRKQIEENRQRIQAEIINQIETDQGFLTSIITPTLKEYSSKYKWLGGLVGTVHTASDSAGNAVKVIGNPTKTISDSMAQTKTYEQKKSNISDTAMFARLIGGVGATAVGGGALALGATAGLPLILASLLGGGQLSKYAAEKFKLGELNKAAKLDGTIGLNQTSLLNSPDAIIKRMGRNGDLNEQRFIDEEKSRNTHRNLNNAKIAERTATGTNAYFDAIRNGMVGERSKQDFIDSEVNAYMAGPNYAARNSAADTFDVQAEITGREKHVTAVDDAKNKQIYLEDEVSKYISNAQAADPTHVFTRDELKKLESEANFNFNDRLYQIQDKTGDLVNQNYKVLEDPKLEIKADKIKKISAAESKGLFGSVSTPASLLNSLRHIGSTIPNITTRFLSNVGVAAVVSQLQSRNLINSLPSRIATEFIPSFDPLLTLSNGQLARDMAEAIMARPISVIDIYQRAKDARNDPLYIPIRSDLDTQFREVNTVIAAAKGTDNLKISNIPSDGILVGEDGAEVISVDDKKSNKFVNILPNPKTVIDALSSTYKVKEKPDRYSQFRNPQEQSNIGDTRREDELKVRFMSRMINDIETNGKISAKTQKELSDTGKLTLQAQQELELVAHAQVDSANNIADAVTDGSEKQLTMLEKIYSVFKNKDKSKPTSALDEVQKDAAIAAENEDKKSIGDRLSSGFDKLKNSMVKIKENPKKAATELGLTNLILGGVFSYVSDVIADFAEQAKSGNKKGLAETLFKSLFTVSGGNDIISYLGAASKYALTGWVIGSTVGLLGGPIGFLGGGLSGAVIGASIGILVNNVADLFNQTRAEGTGLFGSIMFSLLGSDGNSAFSTMGKYAILGWGIGSTIGIPGGPIGFLSAGISGAIIGASIGFLVDSVFHLFAETRAEETGLFSSIMFSLLGSDGNSMFSTMGKYAAMGWGIGSTVGSPFGGPVGFLTGGVAGAIIGSGVGFLVDSLASIFKQTNSSESFLARVWDMPQILADDLALGEFGKRTAMSFAKMGWLPGMVVGSIIGSALDAIISISGLLSLTSNTLSDIGSYLSGMPKKFAATYFTGFSSELAQQWSSYGFIGMLAGSLVGSIYDLFDSIMAIFSGSDPIKLVGNFLSKKMNDFKSMFGMEGSEDNTPAGKTPAGKTPAGKKSWWDEIKETASKGEDELLKIGEEFSVANKKAGNGIESLTSIYDPNQPEVIPATDTTGSKTLDVIKNSESYGKVTKLADSVKNSEVGKQVVDVMNDSKSTIVNSDEYKAASGAVVDGLKTAANSDTYRNIKTAAVDGLKSAANSKLAVAIHSDIKDNLPVLVETGKSIISTINDGLKTAANSDEYKAASGAVVDGLKTAANSDTYRNIKTAAVDGLKSAANSKLAVAIHSDIKDGLKTAANSDEYKAASGAVVDGLKSAANSTKTAVNSIPELSILNANNDQYPTIPTINKLNLDPISISSSLDELKANEDMYVLNAKRVYLHYNKSDLILLDKAEKEKTEKQNSIYNMFIELGSKIGSSIGGAVSSVANGAGNIASRVGGDFMNGAREIGSKIGSVTYDAVQSASNSISNLLQGGESGERGYNAYNRGTGLHSNGDRNLEGMTLGEIQSAQSLPSSDPNRLFAVGKYQMTPDTFKEGISRLKLDPNTKFDKSIQEKLFTKYLAGSKRKPIMDYITGKSNDAVKMGIAAAQEWRSVADPRTGITYADSGKVGNKATISADKFKQTMDNARIIYSENITAGMSEDDAYAKALHGVGVDKLPENPKQSSPVVSSPIMKLNPAPASGLSGTGFGVTDAGISSSMKTTGLSGTGVGVVDAGISSNMNFKPVTTGLSGTGVGVVDDSEKPIHSSGGNFGASGEQFVSSALNKGLEGFSTGNSDDVPNTTGDAKLGKVHPEIYNRLADMASEYKKQTGKSIPVNSAWRSNEQQVNAMKSSKPGFAAAPGRSMHQWGYALDINSAIANELSKLPSAKGGSLLSAYGFNRPMAKEPWHIEPVEIASTRTKIADGFVPSLTSIGTGETVKAEVKDKANPTESGVQADVGIQDAAKSSKPESANTSSSSPVVASSSSAPVVAMVQDASNADSYESMVSSPVSTMQNDQQLSDSKIPSGIPHRGIISQDTLDPNFGKVAGYTPKPWDTNVKDTGLSVSSLMNNPIGAITGVISSATDLISNPFKSMQNNPIKSIVNATDDIFGTSNSQPLVVNNSIARDDSLFESAEQPSSIRQSSNRTTPDESGSGNKTYMPIINQHQASTGDSSSDKPFTVEASFDSFLHDMFTSSPGNYRKTVENYAVRGDKIMFAA